MWCPYSNVNLQKVPDIALSSRSNCAYLHMHQESPRRSTHRVATHPHQTVLPARQWNLRTFRGLEGHKPVLFHLVVFGDDLLQQRDCIRACSRPCGWGGPSYRTPSTIRGCPSVARRCSLSDTWTHPLAAAWVWKDIVIVVGVALKLFPVGSSEEWLCGSSLLTTKSDTVSTSRFTSTLNLQPSTNCRRGWHYE